MKKSAAQIEATETTTVAEDKKPLANINGTYIHDDTKLDWKITANPKRPSGKAYSRFEAYMNQPTVADYIAAGGTMADLKYDQSKGFLDFN